MMRSYTLHRVGAFYYAEGMGAPICDEAVEHLLGSTPRSIRIDVAATRPKRGKWRRVVRLKKTHCDSDIIRVARKQYYLLSGAVRQVERVTFRKIFWVRIVKG